MEALRRSVGGAEPAKASNCDDRLVRGRPRALVPPAQFRTSLGGWWRIILFPGCHNPEGTIWMAGIAVR
jgi:hypothetical protein